MYFTPSLCSFPISASLTFPHSCPSSNFPVDRSLAKIFIDFPPSPGFCDTDVSVPITKGSFHFLSRSFPLHPFPFLSSRNFATRLLPSIDNVLYNQIRDPSFLAFSLPLCSTTTCHVSLNKVIPCDSDSIRTVVSLLNMSPTYHASHRCAPSILISLRDRPEYSTIIAHLFLLLASFAPRKVVSLFITCCSRSLSPSPMRSHPPLLSPFFLNQ